MAERKTTAKTEPKGPDKKTLDHLADTWGKWGDEQRRVYDALDPDTQAEVKAEMKRRAQA